MISKFLVSIAMLVSTISTNLQTEEISIERSSYLNEDGEIYNKELLNAWAQTLECYITGNYCHEDVFQYFLPIKIGERK